MYAVAVVVVLAISDRWLQPSLAEASPPNFVMIMLDDLGYQDVSFNGGQVPTPNIDALRAESILLTKHYVHLMCSPSRTQFLTGRYAMYQGIGKMLPWDDQEIGGIPIGQPTLADWLKLTADYKTYAVGKWHMGYAYHGLLPTARGFDHFYGFYQGAIDYATLKYKDIEFGATDHFDFWQDAEPYCDIDEFVADSQANSMDLYRDQIIEYINDEQRDNAQPFYMYLALQTMHVPLLTIDEYERRCFSIVGMDAARTRQKYCQNLLLTDSVVGSIVQELKNTQNWDNTLLVFTADNGGDIEWGGCNFPFRGTKGSMFDGNTRTVTLVGGGVVAEQYRNTQRDALFSSLDWTPTFLEFAGVLDVINDEDRLWDGRSQYELLTSDASSDYANRRDHIVFNIGIQDLSSASVVFEQDGVLYKFIAENSDIDHWKYNHVDGWCVPDENNNWNIVVDDGLSALSSSMNDLYLFDLTNDVSESTNLLKLDDKTTNNRLMHHALQLLLPYAEHELYQPPLTFLWGRQPEGDPALLGNGAFVAPFLDESNYLRIVSDGFDEIGDAAQAVRNLYTQAWIPPQIETNREWAQSESQQNSVKYVETGKKGVRQWLHGRNLAVTLMMVVVVSVALLVWFKHWTGVVRHKGYTAIPIMPIHDTISI